MGSYLNLGSKGFQESLNSEIYVDKTGLIEKTNAVLNTRQKFLCVSRPRVSASRWQRICWRHTMTAARIPHRCSIP